MVAPRGPLGPAVAVAVAALSVVAVVKAAGAAARAAGDLVASSVLVSAAAAVETAARLLAGTDQELMLRMDAILPVMAEKVAAGADGRTVRLSGATRAARNVGVHWKPGAGPEAVQAALAYPQRAQRRGRTRAGVPSSDSSCASTDVSLTLASGTGLPLRTELGEPARRNAEQGPACSGAGQDPPPCGADAEPLRHAERDAAPPRPLVAELAGVVLSHPQPVECSQRASVDGPQVSKHPPLLPPASGEDMQPGEHPQQAPLGRTKKKKKSKAVDHDASEPAPQTGEHTAEASSLAGGGVDKHKTPQQLLLLQQLNQVEREIGIVAKIIGAEHLMAVKQEEKALLLKQLATSCDSQR